MLIVSYIPKIVLCSLFLLLFSCSNRQKTTIPYNSAPEDTATGMDIVNAPQLPLSADTIMYDNEITDYWDTSPIFENKYIYIQTNQWPYYNMVISP